MMRMYNKLPRFVYLKKEKYFINTDYRIFIEFEKKMLDENNNEVIFKALRNFYPAFFKIIDNNLFDEAVDKFIWFYFCGKNKEQIENNKKSSKKSENNRIYDYDYDSDLIWGAYWDRGFDLTTDYLHWWKFKALFNTMSNDCQFKKVIGYRCYDGKDKDMLELKELNKLPPTKFEINERKRQDKIFEELNKIASQK